ncbi:MAG: glycosyltransferase [Parcubacteria group bacterium]|jgi:glycosyltransferase involved in cell wall biosynthesis
MKIALVHDYLVQNGGAEKVLECFTELFPCAPIYTLLYAPELMYGAFEGKNIKTSFLQNFPFSTSKHRIFPQFMPMAIEQFDFSDFDIVLSDSSSFAKGIITAPETLHICYMHTPMRFAWDDCQKYTRDFYFSKIIKKIIPFVMNYVRVWDRVSADRPDKLIANSNFIARRIKKYYKRESIVIHPPIETQKFYVSPEHDDYFLMVGRFMAYKRFDIVIEAFNQLGLPLKIIGRGPEKKRLEKIAKTNIEFLGRVDDAKLADYFSKARAFIFPQEEDFGLTAIEAMASGRPVIAFRGGDIPEHIEEGRTGMFFETQTAADIVAAIGRFKDADFDPAYIRGTALKFDRELFKSKIKDYIETELALHKNSLNT